MRAKTRRGGGKDASRGDTRQSRSAETRGDDEALTPTPQTHLETSPAWHKLKLGTITRVSVGNSHRKWKAVGGRLRLNNSEFSQTNNDLQMIDVILRVQVNAHGFLLYWHDGKANIYAAMKLSLLQLWKKTSLASHCFQEWATDGATEAIPTSAPCFAYFKMPLSNRKYLWEGKPYAILFKICFSFYDMYGSNVKQYANKWFWINNNSKPWYILHQQLDFIHQNE